MSWPRIILHVDMDAFYASVEALDRPDLRGQPIIVGGGMTRGVVSACSYEARAFGVHSAMPMSQALRCCPQAIVLPVRMERYQAVSRRIMHVLGAYTPLLEQVSVDEAYLDMTAWLPLGSTPERCAQEIQRQILQATQLTCSIGVATGKGIAKMASDFRKPHGLVVVPPGEETAFLAPLPIGKLRGVGEATERKLRTLGIHTIGDLARLPEAFMVSKFGQPGRYLLALARGTDESPVTPEREAKSIGRETTFLTDVSDRQTLELTLLELAEDVAQSLRRHGVLGRGVTVKLRDGEFHTLTRAQSLPEPADTTSVLYQTAQGLLARLNPTRPVRLIGITASPLVPAGDRQLNLFQDAGDEKARRIASAMDLVRARFGSEAITRARLAQKDED